MVECYYTFTVYPRNHSHDDRKIWHLQLGFYFQGNGPVETAPSFNDLDLVMQNYGNIEFPKIQTRQCPVADFQLEQKKHIQPQKIHVPSVARLT